MDITGGKNHEEEYYYYEEEESLTEVKCISLAIIIVGSILCFFQLERIILYICYYKILIKDFLVYLKFLVIL